MIDAKPAAPLTLKFVALAYGAYEVLFFELRFVPVLVNAVPPHPVAELLIWIFDKPFLKPFCIPVRRLAAFPLFDLIPKTRATISVEFASPLAALNLIILWRSALPANFNHFHWHTRATILDPSIHEQL
jgi:hypothetical protein